MNADDAIRLVGFLPQESTRTLRAGAHYLQAGVDANTVNDQGWMSSVAHSPTLGNSIGPGFIRNGLERLGETVVAHDPIRNDSYAVQIVSSHFVDADGERLRG